MARAKSQTRRSAQEIRLAPVVVVKGSEGLLSDRAVRELRRQALGVDSAMSFIELLGVTYEHGQLDMATAPSLFGEPRFVLVPDCELASDDLISDLLTYIQDPPPDVWLIVRHNGGQRGKKVLTAMEKLQIPFIAADPIKYDRDKLAFVLREVKEQGRSIETPAAQVLVDALGSDLRSLISAVSQLMSDVEGTLTVDIVRRYYSGRVEASGFDVADAVVQGNTPQALTMLRHAFATGVQPLLIVGALASKFRTLAKVSGLRQGMSAKGLQLSPWQIDRAGGELNRWSDEGLAQAISSIACADEEVKGVSRDPQRAVEKCVLTLCGLCG